MISKAKIKWVKQFESRKHRLEHQAFVAEGGKLVGELLPHLRLIYLCALPQWLEENAHLLPPNAEVDEITPSELQRTSLLRSPQSVIAVFAIPDAPLATTLPQRELCLALDGVQDPGNMGTIARICDWFGIHHIICSHGTADIFNPKAVQATMGALARVSVHYTDLPQYLSACDAPLYGTFLDGDNLYAQPLSACGIIVMGNEGNGISAQVDSLVHHRLLIPNYPAGSPTTESLNVAVATAIVCAEFRRRGA